MRLLSNIFFALALIALSVLIWNSYLVAREIEGWKTRAQVSSEPNDMLAYMSNVQKGMENWGMTSGYAALLFRTPENNMALIYKTVTNHVNQARVLTTMDHATPEYQTGLDNLRGSIRELELRAYYYWLVHSGMAWIILLIVGLAGGFVSLFLSLPS